MIQAINISNQNTSEIQEGFQENVQNILSEEPTFDQILLELGMYEQSWSKGDSYLSIERLDDQKNCIWTDGVKFVLGYLIDNPALTTHRTAELMGHVEKCKLSNITLVQLVEIETLRNGLTLLAEKIPSNRYSPQMIALIRQHFAERNAQFLREMDFEKKIATILQ